MTMRGALRVLAVATGFWLPTANPAVHAGINGSWDAAADFCATANPCGAWSYGWFATPDTGFTLYTQPSNIGVDAWSDPSLATFEPDDFHNGTPDTITPACCNPIPSGTAGFHPGPNGENSVFRWTAPSSGIYTIAGNVHGQRSIGHHHQRRSTVRVCAHLYRIDQRLSGHEIVCVERIPDLQRPDRQLHGWLWCQ
jgi:hypothetical protein